MGKPRIAARVERTEIRSASDGGQVAALSFSLCIQAEGDGAAGIVADTLSAIVGRPAPRPVIEPPPPATRRGPRKRKGGE